MILLKRAKKTVKRLVGEENVQSVKATLQLMKTPMLGIGISHMTKNVEEIGDIIVLEQDGSHVFCGYYDLPLFSDDENKILVHVINKKAVTGRDSAEIGFYCFKENRFEKITETIAWNWQQGSRLRWSLVDSGCIYVNKFLNGVYCCSKIDVSSKREIKRIPVALYDISRDEKIGITCDFVRLQRLRPGYGYCNTPDITEGMNAPSDSGLYAVNLENNEVRLLVSLDELSKSNDPEKKYEHYINHISISPSGKSVMFFHIFVYDKPKIVSWKTQLCVMDTNGGGLRILEDQSNVSHYTWISDSKLLITGITLPDMMPFYRIYNVNDGMYEEISDSVLCRDGHPSIFENGAQMITDTYPDGYNFQHIIRYDMEKKEGKVFASLFSDPRMFGEKRCDLHPKISKSAYWVAVDSTYSDKRRKVVMFARKN